MSKYIPGNQKQLTLENRIYIKNELNKGTSFKDIARFADRKYREKLRDPRTGINMTKRELRQKDQIISPLLQLRTPSYPPFCISFITNNFVPVRRFYHKKAGDVSRYPA